MVSDMEELRPFRPVSPGEILLDELDAREWTQSEFAEIIGKPSQKVNEIIKGKKPISAEVAILIGEALGTSAEMWLRLEADYRIQKFAKERGSDELVAKKSKLFGIAPVTELIKLKWLNCRKKKGKLTVSAIEEIEAKLCEFFEVSSVDDIETKRMCASFRKGKCAETIGPSLRAWTQKATLMARDENVEDYEAGKFEKHIDELRRLSLEKNVLKQTKNVLSKLGVRMVVAPHLSRTRLDGAAFWLEEDAPVVGTTLRLNRIDNFFFTLFHELAHLSLHKADNGAFLDEDIFTQKEEPEEEEANAQAQEWLLPKSVFRRWTTENAGNFNVPSVRRFAEDIGVHPAIIAGRLQHEELVPYSYMRNIFEKVV